VAVRVAVAVVVVVSGSKSSSSNSSIIGLQICRLTLKLNYCFKNFVLIHYDCTESEQSCFPLHFSWKLKIFLKYSTLLCFFCVCAVCLTSTFVYLCIRFNFLYCFALLCLQCDTQKYYYLYYYYYYYYY